MADNVKWNKAQKLIVGGAVAPSLRAIADRTAKRKITLINGDGEPTGYTTLANVQESLLKAQEIELAVQDGVRPREIVCRDCGRIVKIGATGIVPKLCKLCRAGRCRSCGKLLPGGNKSKSRSRCVSCRRKETGVPKLKCADCGKALAKAVCHNLVRYRPDAVPRCRSCFNKTLNVAPQYYCRSCNEPLARGTCKKIYRRVQENKDDSDNKCARRCMACIQQGKVKPNAA